jgi:hypothetical protein
LVGRWGMGKRIATFPAFLSVPISSQPHILCDKSLNACLSLAATSRKGVTSN